MEAPWAGATRKSQVLRGRGTFWAAMSKITLIGIEFIDENGGGPGARLRKLQLKKKTFQIAKHGGNRASG
jgi:hypothetical protein